MGRGENIIFRLPTFTMPETNHRNTTETRVRQMCRRVYFRNLLGLICPCTTIAEEEKKIVCKNRAKLLSYTPDPTIFFARSSIGWKSSCSLYFSRTTFVSFDSFGCIKITS